MKCAILDTNVLISAFGWDGNEKKALEAALSGRFRMATSPILLEEFRCVASHPRLKFSWPKVEEFLNAVLEVAYVLEVLPSLAVARDYSDNRVLECAIKANADYIITGDKDLLSMKEFKGIRIVTAEAFLKLP